MKKFMLIIIILVLTACKIEKININNYSQIIDEITSNSTEFVNTVSNGYKYYLPFGVTRENASNYNDVLKYNKDYYYLYVDTVSYYHKIKIQYEENDDSYFSKKINDLGYFEINKIEDKYFIEAMYNYAKIEAYVEERNLDNAVINISHVLASIKFNDYIIELSISENNNVIKEENYNIFKPTRKEGSFLEYIEEFGDYEEEIKENELGKESE